MSHRVDAAAGAWPHAESDPQRRALLAAADRLLAGKPQRSTGRLSVVQLAAEADVKYWVVAQKHTDLRDHFQRLVTQAQTSPAAADEPRDAYSTLLAQHTELRARHTDLEKLVTLYATALNELALENQALREQAADGASIVSPMKPRPKPPPIPRR